MYTSCPDAPSSVADTTAADCNSNEQTSERSDTAAQKNWRMMSRKTLWIVLGTALDAFTIGVSVADIVTDVLVLLEFWELGYNIFFGGSLAIFMLAQASYAFLFTASFANHRSSWGRIAVFMAILPFAQLVPVFTWLESMHWTMVDAALRKLGLEPTASSSKAEVADSGDSLWGFLQSKYESHAGFLVEAFVEAVPQAVLQTAFVVVARRSNLLNTVSVAISVFTIASKGYLISYALDGVTFVFNFMCIAADTFGLFACTTVLALNGVSSWLTWTYAGLSISGLVLSVVGGHGVLWFAILDDHLKLRDPKSWPKGVRGVSSVFFDLYVVRIMAWFLAIVPCIVLFAGARLSYLPAFVLRSIDPDLVRHANFYRGLANFLQSKAGGTPGLESRLWTANTFLTRARGHVKILQKRLQRSTGPQRQSIIQCWAAEVGYPQRPSGMYYVPRQWRSQLELPEPQAERDAVQRVVLESLAGARSGSSSTAALLRKEIRKHRLAVWLESHAAEVHSDMKERSEVFKHGWSWMTARKCADEPTRFLLTFCALLALFVVAFSALPLALSHSLLVLLGVLFPVLQAVPTCLADEEAAWLPCGLAVSFCIILMIVAALTPCVMRRQLLWMELVDLRGFPEGFYSGAILQEIRSRHLRDSVLHTRLGHYLTQHTLSFIEE